jgi:hypothetical protein
MIPGMAWDGELRSGSGELRIHGDVDGVVFELRGRMDEGVIEALDAAAEVAIGAHQRVTVDVSRLAPGDRAARAAMATFLDARHDDVILTPAVVTQP